MDEWDLSTSIWFAFGVSVVIAVIVKVFFGGALNLSLEIDRTQQEQFRKTIVLENLVSLDASEGELTAIMSRPYSYDRRRSYIPVEFFTRRDEGSGIGYRKKNGHCFIEKVSGLDGENFGFYVRSLEATGSTDLECTKPRNQKTAVHSPALLVRKSSDNLYLPVRLYIYEIE